MRPGSIHIETKGSNWWIDEIRKEYLRLPLNEKPREQPEWGNKDAGLLQDAVWHHYQRWEIVTLHGIERLRIIVDEEVGDGILAPYPVLIGGNRV